MKFNLAFVMSVVVVSLGTTGESYSHHNVVARCPTYWTFFDGYCYRIFSDEKTWVDAEEYCTRIGAPGGQGIAHLASIHSAEDQEFVHTYWSTHRNEIAPDVVYDNNREYPGLWIGLNDVVQNDDWEWTDGSVFDSDQTFWLPGEPNNDDNGVAEEATALWDGPGHNGGWNDLPHDMDNRTLPFICKTPANECH